MPTVSDRAAKPEIAASPNLTVKQVLAALSAEAQQPDPASLPERRQRLAARLGLVAAGEAAVARDPAISLYRRRQAVGHALQALVLQARLAPPMT